MYNNTEINFINISQSADDNDVVVIVKALNLWLLLIIILVGFSGNSFAVVAIWATQLRRVSSNHYLVALALSDNVFVFGLLMIWLNKLGAPTYHHSATACKMVLFLLSSSGCLSAWYITVLTIERFIVVYYPFYRGTICSVGRTRKTIVALVPWPMLFNVWVLFAGGLSNDHCDINPDYYKISLVLNGVDTIISLVVPFLTIFSLNVAICVRLWFRNDRDFGGSRNQPSTGRRPLKGPLPLGPPEKPSKNLEVYVDPGESRVGLRTLDASGHVDGDEMRKHAGANAKVSNQEKKITKTLLIISFAFVALNLPSYTMRIRDSFRVAIVGANESDISSTELVISNVFLIIYYLNFALNFVVYSLSSKNFRDAVRSLWCFKRFGSPHSSLNSTATTMTQRSKSNRSHLPSSKTPSPQRSPFLNTPDQRRSRNDQSKMNAVELVDPTPEPQAATQRRRTGGSESSDFTR